MVPFIAVSPPAGFWNAGANLVTLDVSVLQLQEPHKR
jgi:hypothetical protein